MKQKLSASLHLCTFALIALFSFVAHAKSEHPNILYIMADDHAAHAISAYGSKINKTPNIDPIARDGMRFANCFAVNSICTPSRAAILTGKYSHVNGVTVFNRLDPNQWNVAKELQKAGYHTGMIGKWHLQSDPQGFDYWNILPGQGVYHDPHFITMGNKHKVEGYVTDIIGDVAINFIKNAPKDKPFFLMCHHKAPHRPWEPAERYMNMYTNPIPEPATFNDDYKNRSTAASVATMRVDRDLNKHDLKQKPPAGLTDEELKKWKYQRYMQDYLRCVASVDDNVGRLLEYLDKAGLSDNTIVIYTSDQGFFLGDHDWFDKRFMYEESLRMPFLVRYPGHIKPGTVTDAMILNVDFAPTFLDYAGVKAPKEVQGKSIKPVLEGKTPRNWRKSMYYRYYAHPSEHTVNKHYGVRTDRYKLIYFHDLHEWELFDLQKDPHELFSVYNDPAYAGVVKDLKRELERLRKELGDHDQWVDKPPKLVTKPEKL